MDDSTIPDVVTPTTPTEGEKNGGENSSTDEQEPKAITPEQHQAELNRIAAKTRKEEREKLDELLEEKRKEWERQAKLSADEREKEARERQEKEVRERELNITIRENKAEAIETFAERGLPTNLVTFVVNANKEEQQANIDTFDKAWKLALEAAVSDRMKGTAPKDPQNKTSEAQPSISLETFM
jgi:transketolase